jgi:flotillin
MAGEAEGRREILMKMAEGFREIVAAAQGDPDAAARLMIVDKLEAVVKAQAQAISNIDFEKVVVYDGGNGQAVGNFLGGLTHALPSMHELAKMAGMELPEFLGRLMEEGPSSERPTRPSETAGDLTRAPPAPTDSASV